MKVFWNNVWEWIKRNRLTVIYFFFAIAIEMVGVATVEKNPFMSRPFIGLGLLLIVSGLVMLTKNNYARMCIYGGLLAVQAVLALVFAVIYDMTGQYFDFGMLKLRNDAFGILESIPVNFITFYAGLLFCVLYVVYGLRFCRREPEVTVSKPLRLGYAAVAIGGLATVIVSVFSYYYPPANKYQTMIDGKTTGAYSSYGMTGNAIGELAKTLFLQDKTVLSSAAMDGFIYKEQSAPTEYFGVSKDKNLVVVVGETFEWYSFLVNEKYPNALDLTNEQLKALYPNIWKFYENSVAMTNFHSKEKTDISETFSIMGSYPTGAYINYDYSENTLPQTIPNIFKLLDPDIQTRSFHNGFKTFYNRNEAHEMFGFERGCPIDMYDMEEMSNQTVANGGAPTMTEYMDDGERNLDSEMIETCKDLMFPTDKRFCTYITTITMHGMYYERKNIASEREELLEALKNAHGGEEYVIEEKSEEEQVLFHYMTTALEFDDAIGCMMADLEKKDLLDNTTIVMFGDHDAYYQELSSYTKDIYDYDTAGNYTDLYTVPLLIYDADLAPQKIDKFTCTADIVPTILDLFGIRYYTNMYYGHSVFSEEQSVLYSRAYDFFLSDGIQGKSVNNMLYVHSSVTKEEIAAYKAEATKLVDRIKHCDYIFRQDYFAKQSNYDTFVAKMKAINV